MKTLKIPKGWRKLRKGTPLQKGDRGWGWDTGRWFYTTLALIRVGYGAADAEPYIRRRKAQKG